MVKAGALETPYKGIIDCAKRIFKQEGMRGFWKGNATNILIYFPTAALSFALKDYFNTTSSLLTRDKNRDGYLAWILGKVASGGFAGSISLFFVYPLDYARTRLTTDVESSKRGGQKQFNGLIDVWKKTVAADGVSGLYRGFTISCISIFIFKGLYFGLYDSK